MLLTEIGISNLSASGKSEMTGELHMDTTFQNDFNFCKKTILTPQLLYVAMGYSPRVQNHHI